MKFKAMILVLILSCGLIGCSYLDDKKVEEVRNQLKSADKTSLFQPKAEQLAILKELGISLTVKNDYPTLVWTMKFNTLNKDDIPASELSGFSAQMDTELCQAMGNFNQGTAKQRQLVARVFEEDSVAIKFIIKDKIGREMATSSKVLSTCPEFLTLKNGN